MSLQTDLAEVASCTPENVATLVKNLPEEWIVGALQETGTATIRLRRLPADQVVWLVIGIAMLRGLSIFEVAVKLDLALPGRTPAAAPASVSQARTRLGDAAMAWLFARCADAWAHASAATDRWQGLALYAVDGTKLTVADTPENTETFGKWVAGPGESAFPLVRLVALMAVRSRLIAAVEFGPFEVAEVAYAASLWRCLPDQSLVLLDRLYVSAANLLALTTAGANRHWLTPVRKNMKRRVLERLGKNDVLVEIDVRPEARAKDPSLPKTWTARAITYRRKGFLPRTLLTSLVDPIAYPAVEIVALYHERWEIELGYNEIKTHLLDGEPVLRSKSPALVRQEIWGILIAYNLVRLEITKVAAQANLPPSRISFSAVLHLVVHEWLWCAIASPGNIPKRLVKLREALVALVLPPRRSQRSYPREVKVQRSSYPRNRRSTRTTPTK